VKSAVATLLNPKPVIPLLAEKESAWNGPDGLQQGLQAH